MLRKSGHGASLDSGLIPDAFVEWRAAASMRHEREMVQALVSRGEFRPGLALERAELAGIENPLLHVFGSADPVGTVDLWKDMASVLKRGELRVVDGAGHMPWFDDPASVAGLVRKFLAGDET
jgi:pimeloyl-ACP methyl ester carboxylesterase